jgi:hypothetical protein
MYGMCRMMPCPTTICPLLVALRILYLLSWCFWRCVAPLPLPPPLQLLQQQNLADRLLGGSLLLLPARDQLIDHVVAHRVYLLLITRTVKRLYATAGDTLAGDLDTYGSPKRSSNSADLSSCAAIKPAASPNQERTMSRRTRVVLVLVNVWYEEYGQSRKSATKPWRCGL